MPSSSHPTTTRLRSQVKATARNDLNRASHWVHHEPKQLIREFCRYWLVEFCVVTFFNLDMGKVVHHISIWVRGGGGHIG